MNKKIAPRNIRFTQPELDKLRERADASGKKLSPYIHDAAMAHAKVGLDDPDIKRIFNELSLHYQLYEHTDRMVIEMAHLLTEVLGKIDPQAVSRVKQKIESLTTKE